jgi:hypothetical protein
MPLTTTVTATAWVELTEAAGQALVASLPAGARWPVHVVLAASAPPVGQTEPADGAEAITFDPARISGSWLTPSATARVYARCAIEGAVQRVNVMTIRPLAAPT